MQLGQAQVVRQDWYDRALLVDMYSYSAAVSPHASTVRFTYTVPANRVALISIGALDMFTEAAATAAGLYRMFYEMDISGAGYVVNYILDSLDNTVNSHTTLNINRQVRLAAGDSIRLTTLDNSTGGIKRYTADTIVNEYNA